VIPIRPGQTLRQPFRFMAQDAQGNRTRVLGATWDVKWHDMPFAFTVVPLPVGDDYDGFISATAAETEKAERGDRATVTLRATIPALPEPVTYLPPDLVFVFI
jgi:hypothetical protein